MSRLGTDDSRFCAPLALERGSDASAPLARAILFDIQAREPATIYVLPCLYMLIVKDKYGQSLLETDTVNHSTF